LSSWRNLLKEGDKSFRRKESHAVRIGVAHSFASSLSNSLLRGDEDRVVEACGDQFRDVPNLVRRASRHRDFATDGNPFTLKDNVNVPVPTKDTLLNRDDEFALFTKALD